MKFNILLKKMETEFLNPIKYYFFADNTLVNANQLIGRKVEIKLIGYQCLSCHEKKEIFRQGYCKKCFYGMPQVGEWVIRPELSTAHLNIEDRDLEYEKKVQLQPHIVYIAWTGNTKIGVTRKSQIPTRWIDQGATQAIPIVEVPNRYLAGITEMSLKNYFSDKTNWRKMLTDISENINLEKYIKEIEALMPKEVSEYIPQNRQREITEIIYPLEKIPEKVNSLNLQKTPVFQGVLSGIRGQYWIFEDNSVFNMRSNEGKIVEVLLLQ